MNTGNKRILKNTFFLYFRMIFVLLVSLYATRVVLNVLGVVDYGIYKSRGFYFGIQNDNAVFGNSITLLESTSHKVTTEKNIKINTYQLVDMNTRNSYYKCRFWEINKLVYLTLQKIGERDILTYVLSPKNK